MKTGLIMEGGGMRGMFTCGILDVFLQAGITFDGAAGISAGAVFGVNFKSRQYGRALRYNKTYCRDPRYGSFRNFLRTGNLYDVDFAYHELPEKLDIFDAAAFAANPMEFWVGATNVDTGLAEYHLCTDGLDHDVEWMRASASIPLLSRIVEIDGLRLVDGGTADPVPYRFMTEQQGYDRTVTVLTREPGFVKTDGKLLYRLMLRKYPALRDALLSRPERYNALYRYIESEAAAGRTLILRPPVPLNIGSMTTDPDALQAVYDIGRETALAQLDAVREWLT